TRIYPAAHDAVIAVGAVTNENRVAEFSSRGDWVSVFAPGTGIAVATKGGEYSRRDGTDVACATVASVCALLSAARPNTPASVLSETLRTTATRFIAETPIPGRIVNAYGADLELHSRAETPVAE
ncbi:MAG TPA: S8 family serine peptidase, partial [Burkholderiaceae bacterium]|nr:S8 family serine peptidase [Burkholderiaceae bacterium]